MIDVAIRHVDEKQEAMTEARRSTDVSGAPTSLGENRNGNGNSNGNGTLIAFPRPYADTAPTPRAQRRSALEDALDVLDEIEAQEQPPTHAQTTLLDARSFETRRTSVTSLTSLTSLQQPASRGSVVVVAALACALAIAGVAVAWSLLSPHRADALDAAPTSKSATTTTGQRPTWRQGWGTVQPPMSR